VSVLRATVATVVAVVGTATVLGLLDRFYWPFELADVFRLQYLAVLVAAALGSLALRRRRLAAVAAVLAAVNLGVLGISLIPTATAASGPAAGSLRVVVANVEVGNSDFAAVERLVAQTHPDVFGVTELTRPMADDLARALPAYRARLVRTRHDAYGIGVYSRRPLLGARVLNLPADGPPTIVARVLVAGEPVTLVVTHVHTTFAGSIHARQLHALGRASVGKRVAICGDFNSPPWSAPMRKFASGAGLRDLYGGRAWAAYSWPTWSSLLRVPLDNCFVGSGLVVRAHRDGPGDGSDHRPLVVDLAVVR
jgi:endonuclease/exonuclease/phosphatase (EEP) superfamily protein YafD